MGKVKFGKMKFVHFREGFNGGSITAAYFKLNHTHVLVGYSFSNPVEQFKKKKGRLIAKNRLESYKVKAHSIRLQEGEKPEEAIERVLKYKCVCISNSCQSNNDIDKSGFPRWMFNLKQEINYAN